jgi:hypothetical protein
MTYANGLPGLGFWCPNCRLQLVRNYRRDDNLCGACGGEWTDQQIANDPRPFEAPFVSKASADAGHAAIVGCDVGKEELRAGWQNAEACLKQQRAEAHVLKVELARLEEKLEHAKRYRAICGCGEYMDEHTNLFESGHSPVAMPDEDCRQQRHGFENSELAAVKHDRDKLAAEVIRLRAPRGPKVSVDYED